MKYCFKCAEQIADMEVNQCPKCGNKSFAHNKEVLEKYRKSQYKIPDEVNLEHNDTLLSPKEAQTEASSTEKQISLEDIHELIAAQNRTTHSVRAFVRFLFIQLTTLTLVAFIWNLASARVDPVACAQNGEHCSPIGALQTLAVIIWIIGVVWSSSAGWSELEKSEIPR